MARGEPPRQRPPLPAPYRSPWSGLAEALGAVLADLRLSLRRLWRRNREGDLSYPGFWPRDLAPLFWPLLLGVVVAGLAGLGGWLVGMERSSQPPALPAPASRSGDGTARSSDITPWNESAGPGSTQPSQAGSPAPEGRVERAGERQQPGQTTGAAVRTSANAAGADKAGAADGAEPGSAPHGRAPDRGSGRDSAAPELVLDPLLELLSQGNDAKLLLEARPDPAGSRLSLILSPAAEALPQAGLQQQAERWQQRAREAGYERLELRDSQGRLRGRGALVGSGMILLAPVPGS